MSKVNKGLFLILAALLLATTLAAQNPPLAFEVASVKPSTADPNSSGINTTKGRMYAYNVTLKRCIMGAYGVGPNEIIGGPDWLDSQRFDIIGTAAEPVGDSLLMKMLQTLLSERFKLMLHHEEKSRDAYVLEVRNNAPKLTKGNGEGATTSNGRGHIIGTNHTMDRFAQVLSRQMDLPVVNRTGLEGVFNIDLQWIPDAARVARADGGAPAEGPSIFTAIQEQLGLRLRAAKVPVDVIVIDRAEKPDAN